MQAEPPAPEARAEFITPWLVLTRLDRETNTHRIQCRIFPPFPTVSRTGHSLQQQPQLPCSVTGRHPLREERGRKSQCMRQPNNRLTTQCHAAEVTQSVEKGIKSLEGSEQRRRQRQRRHHREKQRIVIVIEPTRNTVPGIPHNPTLISHQYQHQHQHHGM